MATAEFSKFAGILSAALSQHPGKNLAFICSLSIVESRHCCRYFTKIGLPWSQPCYYSWFSDTEREDQWWPERLKRELREWRAGWDIGIGIYTLLPWRLRGKESACRQAMIVLSLSQKDPLEEEMATHSVFLHSPYSFYLFTWLYFLYSSYHHQKLLYFSIPPFLFVCLGVLLLLFVLFNGM